MNIKDLANNIKTFTEQFEAHLRKHGAYDKVCDFYEEDDCRTKGVNICGTPACFGGEIAIMYDELGQVIDNRLGFFYIGGAALLAKNLGFKSFNSLITFFL